jgi:hypothetical protein
MNHGFNKVCPQGNSWLRPDVSERFKHKRKLDEAKEQEYDLCEEEYKERRGCDKKTL